MKIKLNSYKLLFRLLDLLSNNKWLHKLVINRKVYLGASIISLSMANSGCTSSKINVCQNSNTDTSKLNNPTSDNKTDSSSKDLQNNQNQDTTKFSYTFCYKSEFNEESEEDSSKSIVPDSLPIIHIDYEPVPMCYISVKIPDYKREKNTSNVSPLISNYYTIAPDFNGENISRINDLASNIRRPKGTEKVQGTIFVQFTITINGTIRNVRIQKGLHPMLDEEIVKAVKKMQNWVWPINYTPDFDLDYVVLIQILSNEN